MLLVLICLDGQEPNQAAQPSVEAFKDGVRINETIETATEGQQKQKHWAEKSSGQYNEFVDQNFIEFIKQPKALFAYQHSKENISNQQAWISLIQDSHFSFSRLIQYLRFNNYTEVFLYAGAVRTSSASYSSYLLPQNYDYKQAIENLNYFKIDVNLVFQLEEDVDNYRYSNWGSHLANLVSKLNDNGYEIKSILIDQPTSKLENYHLLATMLYQMNQIFPTRTVIIQEYLDQDIAALNMKLNAFDVEMVKFSDLLLHITSGSVFRSSASSFDELIAQTQKIQESAQRVNASYITAVHFGGSGLSNALIRDQSVFYASVARYTAQYQPLAFYDYNGIYNDLLCSEPKIWKGLSYIRNCSRQQVDDSESPGVTYQLKESSFSAYTNGEQQSSGFSRNRCGGTRKCTGDMECVANDCYPICAVDSLETCYYEMVKLCDAGERFRYYYGQCFAVCDANQTSQQCYCSFGNVCSARQACVDGKCIRQNGSDEHQAQQYGSGIDQSSQEPREDHNGQTTQTGGGDQSDQASQPSNSSQDAAEQQKQFILGFTQHGDYGKYCGSTGTPDAQMVLGSGHCGADGRFVQYCAHFNEPIAADEECACGTTSRCAAGKICWHGGQEPVCVEQKLQKPARSKSIVYCGVALGAAMLLVVGKLLAGKPVKPQQKREESTAQADIEQRRAKLGAKGDFSVSTVNLTQQGLRNNSLSFIEKNGAPGEKKVTKSPSKLHK